MAGDLGPERHVTCYSGATIDTPFREKYPSCNHFDARPVTGRLGERRIACDDRRLERLRQSHIHGVVRRNVFPQFPRASQEIDVGMTVEIEIGQIRNRLGRPLRGHLACPYESTESLRHFNVCQVR